MLSLFNVGDLLLAKIISFDRTRDPNLTIREAGLGKITRGHVIKITPAKVPRLIGRKGSMISVLKQETNCYITVGKNGLVLVSCTKPELEAIAILAIRTIEKEAHTSGLTNKISELIKKEKKEKGLNAV